MQTMAVLPLLLALAGCASAPPAPRSGAGLPPGVRVSETCGDRDPIPRLRVFGVDPRGQKLEGALVEVRDGRRVVAKGRADREGAILFALEARPYTVAWERHGFAPPAPFPVRAKKGCEVRVVIQASLPPGSAGP